MYRLSALLATFRETYSTLNSVLYVLSEDHKWTGETGTQR
jgi:hypothetical protein